MKILYDHQIFSLQKYGGISKYFCELIRNLPSENQFTLCLLLSDNQYLKEDYQHFRKNNIYLPDRNFKGKGFLKKRIYDINKLYSKHIVSLNDYDLLHPTYFDTYFLNNLKKSYIITIHDLIEFKFKEQFKGNSLMSPMERIIKKANRIISVSENTKKDIIDIFNINPDRIDVIYHGFNRPQKKETPNPYGRYILFVGKRNGYKNFSTFAKAVSILIKRDIDLQLICVGLPFNREEVSQLRDLNILEKTKVFGVNENELNILYSNAQAFVYPTLYEGFGMPILEAFANYCPVCLSNTSSLPEIAGDAGAYFEPTNLDSILAAIEKVIYNPGFSNEIVNAGNCRLSNFSWKLCAEKTANSYMRALA